MINKRIFIFRINGVDSFIADNANDALTIYEQLERQRGFKYLRTELNSMTTTYHFELHDDTPALSGKRAERNAP